jgi:hypothetical protein
MSACTNNNASTAYPPNRQAGRYNGRQEQPALNGSKCRGNERAKRELNTNTKKHCSLPMQSTPLCLAPKTACHNCKGRPEQFCKHLEIRNPFWLHVHASGSLSRTWMTAQKLRPFQTSSMPTPMAMTYRDWGCCSTADQMEFHAFYRLVGKGQTSNTECKWTVDRSRGIEGHTLLATEDEWKRQMATGRRRQ